MPKESKTARYLRRALCSSAALTLLAFVLCIIFDARDELAKATLFPLLGVTLVFGVVRFAHVLFAELQARLSEWLLTFLVPPLLMPILLWVLGGSLRNHDTVANDPVLAAGLMIGLLLCALLGSAWAWHALKRLSEQRSLKRVFVMLLGWLLIPGVGCGAIFLLMSLIVLVVGLFGGEVRFSSESLTFYFRAGVTSLLAAPALVLEWKLFKYEKSLRKPQR